MSDLTITTCSSGGEVRKILMLNDLPVDIRDRVLFAAHMVAVRFANGEISECDSNTELDLEELENAVHEMERYAQPAGPRACN